MPVVLSDAAWDAYDKGIAEERGDEPRKGDLLICKRIVVVSTPWGPLEERITFRIEELEYAGNIRITIGKPTLLMQSASIVALRERIERLALKNHQIDEMDEGSNEEDEAIEAEAEAIPAPPGQTNSGASVDVEMETVIDAAPDILPDAAPIPSLDLQTTLEQEEDQTVAGAHSPLPTHTSPIVSRSSAQFQIDTQLEVEATQAQVPPQPARNPLRRNRGGAGYSMGREGFETTRGDNLTGPQAPTLHLRKSLALAEPPKVEPTKDKLLDLLSKLPGEQPRNRTPEPSAPVSAQQEVTIEEVVVETPAKKKPNSTTIAVEEDATAPTPAQKPSVVVSGETQRKRRRPSPTSLESTSAPRSIYRIPKNQLLLLDDQSSWLPPAPGHEFPHPNVPVKLLKLWNTKAELDTSSPSQPSHIALIERSSGEKSIEEVAQADESESDSDEIMSEDEGDEQLEWSQSQSRSQALPPDSSAGPSSSAHTARLGSRDGAALNREQASTKGLSDTSNGGKGKSTQGGSQRESPRTATKTPRPSESPAQTASSKNADSLAKQKTHSETRRFTAPNVVASQPTSSSRQNTNPPVGSSRPQAAPAMSQTAKQRSSQQNSPLPPASGANARPVQRQEQRRPAPAPIASQPPPTGPRSSASLADNHRGPVSASTQKPPHLQYRRTEQRMGSSFATPPAAPTEPRAIRESHHSLPNRKFSGSSKSTPDPKSLPHGGFYCPQPSGQRRETLPSGTQKDTAPSGPQSSGQRRDTLPSGPKKDTAPTRPQMDRRPSSQTSRPDPASTQASEMETSVPRSMTRNEHRQQRSYYMRDAQRKHW
jgi:hypothetical protein